MLIYWRLFFLNKIICHDIKLKLTFLWWEFLVILTHILISLTSQFKYWCFISIANNSFYCIFYNFFIALFSIIFTVVFYSVFQQLFIFYVLLIHLLRSNWAVFEVKWLFVFTFYIFIWFFAWFAKFTCKMRFCVKIFYHKFPLNSKNQPKN